jgi:hypothetical protein
MRMNPRFSAWNVGRRNNGRHPPPSQNTPRPSRTCPSAARGMTYVKPPGVGRPTGRRTVVAALTDTRRAPTENWVRKAWD